jgi:hypothetical protein
VILCRPAELEQLLLDLTARPRQQRPLGGGAPHAEELTHLGAARDLGEHGGVGGCDEQLAGCSIFGRIVARDDEAPVPRHRLLDVDGHRLRHRELGEPLERGQHLLCRVTGGAGVPEPEARDPVGVHVLWSPLQLGEDRELVAGVVGVRVRHLEQHGAVTLHDQRPVRHNCLA